MGMEVSTDSIVVASKDQVFCDLGGEAAILNLKSACYYGLNPVGARIWQLIQEPRTVSELKEAILAEYDVEAERCESDVMRLLRELAEQGLVEVRS